MEVGDLDRSGNSDDAKFSNTIGDDGSAGTNNRFTKAGGNNETAQTGQIISFAAEDSDKVWDTDAVSMGAFQQALENISFLRAQVGGGMSRLSFAADSLSVQQTNIRAALDGLRMWTSQRRVRTYPSTAFLRRQRHPWSHRLIVPMMWL